MNVSQHLFSLHSQTASRFRLTMISNILKKFNKLIKSNQVTNIVESSYLIRYVRQLAGSSVFTIKSTAGETIVSTFTLFGFISFIFWYTLYFYSLYKVYIEDQTILRALYDTKLKRYGDEFERITNTLFVLYALWKVPFDLSGSTEDMQFIVDVDKAFRELGEELDYSKKIKSLIIICTAQIFISGTRILSVWISFRNLDNSVPIAKVFQMLFTDYIAFVITAQYCTYLIILKRRYKIINRVLTAIKVQSKDFFMFRLNQPDVSDKVRSIKLQAKYSSIIKLKSCGKIYSMIYKATETANDKFGSVILYTMLMTLLFIVLYLYYFMEATASGLFHDTERYIDFLIYVFWQIGFALCIEHAYIYFSEATVKEVQEYFFFRCFKNYILDLF